ncbi:MAG: methyl-accepting chemotaxis protein [Candidatus Eisenbacteria bacterium]
MEGVSARLRTFDWKKDWILAVAVIAPLLALGYLVLDFQLGRHRALSRTRTDLLAEQYTPMQSDVQQFFTLSYQSVRTISLLPSVRGISGGDRPDDSRTAVELGRFPVEGDRTVQQLYNNLAANVSVSEVYAITRGFDPSRGEVPFFMYDALKLGTGDESAVETEPGADSPEESEDAEYAYYPKQIEVLEASHPRFDFRNLDDIPAVASPPMRTCDNTQYDSRAKGDPRDAEGILYSVPFYGPDGEFRGIVSAIFRTNVLEAQLLGVPCVPVTDADRERQAREGWSLPKAPGNFVLANPKYGVWVADRRDPSLVAAAKALVAGDADRRLRESWYVDTLRVAGDAPWLLAYRYDPIAIGAAMKRETSRFLLTLLALLVFTAAVVLGPVGIHVKRTRVLEVDARIREIAAGGGDLTRRLDVKHRDEVGRLGRGFDELLDTFHDLIGHIKHSANGVSGGASEIAKGSETLSEELQRQAVRSQEITGSLEVLSRSARTCADHAQDTSRLALRTSEAAEHGSDVMRRSREVMHAAVESAEKIVAIVALVEEIALQTNMLSLNAAVEAARAGEHGKGFSIVAAEVRALATRTSKAAREIHELIDESSKRTTEMSAGVESACEGLGEVAQAIRGLASRIGELATENEQQSAEIGGLTRSLGEIDRAVQSNSAVAEESAAVAASLTRQSRELQELVGRFRVREAA